MNDVPEMLLKTQKWFAGIITRPIDLNSNMNPISPAGLPMKEEAKDYILPSPTLEPYQRIEIYNQQYWWRLLTILHDNLPLLTRLFGYTDFNQVIGFPYLTACPPDTWSLNPLGSRAVDWLEKTYHEKDRSFVLDAAKLDVAYNDGFTMPQLPPVTLDENGDINDLLNQKLTLQPTVSLYRMDYHLFPFRQEMLGEAPEYWEEHPFPELVKEKDVCTLLYRNQAHNMCFEEIDPAEHFLLSQFEKGRTIAKACEALEQQGPGIVRKAENHLSEWFHKWAVRGLLTAKHEPA